MKTVIKIGVDARPLSPPIKGIGRYLSELLLKLIKLTPDWEWYLYSSKAIPEKWTSYPNIKTRQLKAGNVRGLSTFTVQIAYPFWERLDALDVFWSPRHHLPLFLSNKVKTVLTIHDVVWLRAPETMRRGGALLEKVLMPASVKRASVICCVSNSTKSDVVDLLNPSSRYLDVIYPAARLHELFLDEDFKLNNIDFCSLKRKYFLFVGTLEPRKNIPKLLEAYKLYLDSGFGELCLIIVGSSGWKLNRLDELILRNELDSNVIYLEYVSDNALAFLYKYAHALLMPSLYEGFGLPLLESMAFGVPVITSDNSSMPEVSGDSGLLIDPSNVSTICDALIRITQDSQLYEKLSRRAKQISQSYSWEKSANKMIALINECASDMEKR